MNDKNLPPIEGTEYSPEVEDTSVKADKNAKTRRGFDVDRRVKIGTMIGLPAIMLAGVATAIVLQPSNSQPPPPPIATVTTPPPVEVTNKDLNFWQQDGTTKYPSPLEEWQTIPHTDMKAKDQRAMREYYSTTKLASSASLLPSARSGWVTDPDKEFLKDGSPNPRFTPVTNEMYLNAIESYIERLINPIFGDWRQYQYIDGEAKNLDESIFADMFTTEYLSKNRKKTPDKYIPIYADWGSNDYKEPRLLDNGPRWIGKVDSVKSTMKFDEKKDEYKSRVIVDVTYTAWAEDQTALTRKGVLTLDIVTKPVTDRTPVQIDNASLDLK